MTARLNKLTAGFALLVLTTMATTASAAPPTVISYQGYLTGPAGEPIDDSVLITFAIYDVPGDGVALWAEGQLVDVDQGLFSVTLGESIPLPVGIASAPRYLGITVGTDVEMIPRRTIESSMFALAAEDATLLDGAPASAYDQGDHVVDVDNPHQVTASQVGAATAGDIATHAADSEAHQPRYTDADAVNAVLANDGPGSGLDADFVDGISAEMLVTDGDDAGRSGVAGQLFEGASPLASLYVNEGQSNSVDSAMVVNNSLTANDLAADSVTASEIATGAVGSDEIGTNAVGSSEIATAAVGSSEIATNAVGESEIAPNAVAASEIASGAVGASELNFSINAIDSDNNGGLISLTNTADGSGGNFPFGLLGAADGSAANGPVIGVGGISPPLGAGVPMNLLPDNTTYGVIGVVDVGTGAAAITNGGIGLYADGTTMATKGVGVNGPTRGYSGVQGTTNFDGNSDVDINGFEIGLLGVSTGDTVSDNFGVYGYSNNIGVFGNGVRLAGKFTGDVEVGENGEMTLTGPQLTMQASTGERAIVLDADADGVGRIEAGKFEVTGGSDLSENFDIAPATGSGRIEPGTVVSIDPASVGQLTVSTEAYDRKVAGIVSGAGGVRTGMVMGQRGSVADGAYPIALTGRVYVKADASGLPIRPGDLLTTSDLPGYAMRVSDHTRAPGATIGKAMTALETGRGLVLVLVTLQ